MKVLYLSQPKISKERQQIRNPLNEELKELMGEDLIYLLNELLIQKNRYDITHKYVVMYNKEFHWLRRVHVHDPCIKCECFETEKFLIKYEKPDDVEAILKEKYFSTNPKIIKHKEDGNENSSI
jgi:hypothetical protein